MGFRHPQRLLIVFFFPINVDVPMTRLPVTNWVLIGLICCISILGWANVDLFILEPTPYEQTLIQVFGQR